MSTTPPLKSSLPVRLPATTRSRRTFMKRLGSGVGFATFAGLYPGTLSAASGGETRIKLGLDNYSVRAMGWKAPALLDANGVIS